MKYKNVERAVSGPLKLVNNGVNLKIEQVQMIDNALGNATRRKKELERITAIKEKNNAIAERDTARTMRANLLAAFSAIDPTIADAKTPEAKAKAIRALLAAKPGANSENQDIKNAGEEDWKTINELAHNKAVDENL